MTLSFRTENISDLKYILNDRILIPVNHYTIENVTKKRMLSILGEKVLLDIKKVGLKYILYFDDGTDLSVIYVNRSHICDIITPNHDIIGKHISINILIIEL